MKTVRSLLPLLALLLIGGVAVMHGEDAGAQAKKSYIHSLGLGDRLRISVFQEDDLTTLSRIDARGRVNLPLIGEIAIGGMSVTEAQTVVENAYKDGRYLRNPQVTINVEEYAPRVVSISGQIRNPAQYALPIEAAFTIVDLVTKAGGITDIGKGSAVSITRKLPDGTSKTFIVDVDALMKGKKNNNPEDKNLVLQPGDIVYVPERLI